MIGLVIGAAVVAVVTGVVCALIRAHAWRAYRRERRERHALLDLHAADWNVADGPLGETIEEKRVRILDRINGKL